MPITRVCLYCGIEFEGNPKANYCTTSHRVLDYRKRNGLPVTPFKQTDQIKAQNLLIETLREQNALLRAKLSNRPSEVISEPTNVIIEPVASSDHAVKVRKGKAHSKPKKPEPTLMTEEMAIFLGQEPDREGITEKLRRIARS